MYGSCCLPCSVRAPGTYQHKPVSLSTVVHYVRTRVLGGHYMCRRPTPVVVKNFKGLCPLKLLVYTSFLVPETLVYSSFGSELKLNRLKLVYWSRRFVSIILMIGVSPIRLVTTHMFPRNIITDRVFLSNMQGVVIRFTYNLSTIPNTVDVPFCYPY